jgi:hypothetical protein
MQDSEKQIVCSLCTNEEDEEKCKGCFETDKFELCDMYKE